MTDYTEIAHQAFEDVAPWPPTPRDVEAVRPYLLRTLFLLPPADHIGYCQAPPGGENSITLPDGTLVRVGRVCWPNGQIVKIMNDVPNGGPQWVEEDIRPELYLPYSTEPVPPTPEPPSDLEPRLEAVEIEVAELKRQVAGLIAVNAGLQGQISELAKQIADIHDLFVAKPLPPYVARLFGITIRSYPE